MAKLSRLAERQENRSAALKRKKELLARSPIRDKTAVGEKVPALPQTSSILAKKEKVASVRMLGDSILSLSIPQESNQQHTSPALRDCVDIYLQAAQCGLNEILLLWPGALDSIPLIHAIATTEYWAQGYKKGIRSIVYPATNATFRHLNHVFVNREEIHVMNNEVREISFEGKNPAVKDGCEQKDLMLFALNSLKSEAIKENLHPCLNEILPHFFLEKGTRNEIESKNYGNSYLSHLQSKLSKRGHAKSLRESTLPELGNPSVAPDAMFGLSYKMSKQQLDLSLRSLKSLGKFNVLLIDATRIAFQRVERLQNRISTLARLTKEVFGEDAPGIVIVTNDPRQMTQIRAAIVREEQGHNIKLNFRPTRGVLIDSNGLGLCNDIERQTIELDSSTITVTITDRESSKLVVKAYRLAREKGATPSVTESLTLASEFVQRMANLPSATELLYKWMEDSMADETQRRRYDWVYISNRLKKAVEDVEIDIRKRIEEWINQASAVLHAQQDGTPLARAILEKIKSFASTNENLIIIVQSRWYAELAKEYVLRDPESERFKDRVRFTPIHSFKEKITTDKPLRIIVCALSPALLRWTITTKTLPGPIEFLLTQQTALGARYSLEPVLGFNEFKPYFSRVRAIYEPILAAQGALAAVMPSFDYLPPTFTLTTPGTVNHINNGDRLPTDYIDIQLEDGRCIHRARYAKVYIYDPETVDSRSLGFRSINAEQLDFGHQLFVMSDAMREQAEAAFARAGVVFDEASKYEKTLRAYHAHVTRQVTERFPGTLAEAAKAIRDAMQKTNCNQELGSIRYWINLKHAEKTPFDDLMPQAPRHFETFKIFMEVLGFDTTMIQVYWDGAVKRVRGTRISDGLNLGEHYDRVLLDPNSAATYDRLTPEILNALRSNAIDNIFEVTNVVKNISTTRGS